MGSSPFGRVEAGPGGVKAKPFGRFAALTPPGPASVREKGELFEERLVAFLLSPGVPCRAGGTDRVGEP